MVPAAWAAGLILLVAACTLPNQQQASNSPEASPSPAASPTPSSSPTPAGSPAAATSPSPVPSPSPAKLIIKSVTFHIGEVGLSYVPVTVAASGGVKPYKWSISSGSLPPGLSLSPSKGSVTGTPTTTGTFPFVVRVDDAASAAAGAPWSIFVFRQIAWTAATGTCTGYVISGCTIQLKYTGGASSAPKLNVTQSTKYPPLPAGSTFTAKAGVVSVSIAAPGCKAAPNGYFAVVTLVLVDQSPCGAAFNCSSGTLSLTIRLLVC